MALSIKDPEADRLARELAAATNESLTDTIREALRERLDRQLRRPRPSLASRVRVIQARAAALPVLDARSADEILGYDEHGVPH